VKSREIRLKFELRALTQNKTSLFQPLGLSTSAQHLRFGNITLYTFIYLLITYFRF